MKAPAIELSAPAQEGIDPTLTLALAQASFAAYSDYLEEPFQSPPNYRLVARWTGWNEFALGFGAEARFGLLFQSVAPAPTGTYIFAFRGTNSDMDVYADLFVNTVAFSPYRGQVSPVPSVANGFYSIYNSMGGSMTQSMRQQLFSLFNQYQPQKVYVTGHSLGGALSQLFTLDLGVSMPETWVANLNFASPMVGLSDWQTAYESQPAQNDPARRTIRVYNYWDYVPALPGWLIGYKDVGRGFRTSFYVKNAWYPYLWQRHSLANLQTVLENAVWQNPQVWVSTFPDAFDPNLQMSSVIPPGGPDVDWVAKMQELENFEQAILEGAPVPAGLARSDGSKS
jgi:triacylglycerol lipase